MNRILLFSTLLSVIALSTSSLAGNNRYGNQHQSRNSLHSNYRGGNRYHSGPSAPSAPSSPHHPRSPHAPSAPAYGASRGHGYGSGLHQSAPSNLHRSAHNSGVHQSAPGPYGGGRHYNPSNAGLNHFGHSSGPAPYGGPVPYAGQVHGSSGGSHFSSSKRSVYQPQESSYGSQQSRSNFQSHQPQQNYAQSHQSHQSTAQTHGREMKYTINDPKNRGTTHVTETHIVSNKQMHGAEAEAAMKKLMGSMGPASDGGFNDFVKGMGLPFY